MSKVSSYVFDDIAAAREVNTGMKAGQSVASPPLLLRAPRAAALLNTSVRTLRTLNATGRIPRAIRLGRSTYWRPDELKAWVTAGCPDRVTWQAMQQL